MLFNRLDVSTHKGIKNQLGLKFILEGKLDARYGVIYSRLFQSRQAGDYEDFVFCNAEMYSELRPMAEDFITVISDLIKINTN